MTVWFLKFCVDSSRPEVGSFGLAIPTAKAPTRTWDKGAHFAHHVDVWHLLLTLSHQVYMGLKETSLTEERGTNVGDP